MRTYAKKEIMGIPARQKMIADLAARLPASMSLNRNTADLYAVSHDYQLSDLEYWALLSILQERYRERQESTVPERNRLVRDAQRLDFDSMTDVERVCCPEWRMRREK